MAECSSASLRVGGWGVRAAGGGGQKILAQRSAGGAKRSARSGAFGANVRVLPFQQTRGVRDRRGADHQLEDEVQKPVENNSQSLCVSLLELTGSRPVTAAPYNPQPSYIWNLEKVIAAQATGGKGLFVCW